ncbi:hypothetical protein DN412_37550 [Cupriavidus lacunae]|uniref:Uncharacterized protein n=1 Tax=Cupriavidus lacunae TaxID=2666307 RepID=A0A370NI95_9BURK|nr:hypothetical protein DN412_37550 [Cupriavidus lacunae]
MLLSPPRFPIFTLDEAKLTPALAVRLLSVEPFSGDTCHVLRWDGIGPLTEAPLKLLKQAKKTCQQVTD